MTVYLDCAATTPVDPRVGDEVMRFLGKSFGNAGSRTHSVGLRARKALEQARDRVARAAGTRRGDVVFTSGATESNNLATLGLEAAARDSGRHHVVSTRLEHRAVLEPLQELERRGHRVEWVAPQPEGRVTADSILSALRPDTWLVSVMQVNNEIGVRQPIEEIAERLGDHPALFHVDAAQGFGKEPEALRHPRIDLISISGHKLHAPQGIGALVARKRGGKRPQLQPLMWGGGQERGWRPGTHPVALCVGLGLAAKLASEECHERQVRCREFGRQLESALRQLPIHINGDSPHRVDSMVNLSVEGLDARSLIEAWEPFVAISDGAACSSATATCSHVLASLGLSAERMEGAVRLSWSHETPLPDLAGMVQAVQRVQAGAA